MAELVEKLRYEADIEDVVSKHERMRRESQKTSKQQEEDSEKSDRAWSKFTAGLERNAGKMQATGAVMTAAVTGPLLLFGKAAVDVAGDLGEARNKSSVVFGEWSDDLEQWAADADQALGLSERAAFEAAGTFGNLFTSMGLGRGAAADMSKDVVQLASDLGSFNNVDPSEMLEKLRSGLVGEVEPLRAVGINLNAAAVEAKALEMGLADANGEVSEAEKVQARLQIITEQAANATGDFARTADDAANKSRIVAAQYENMQATIGERLLPMKLKLLEAASGVIGVFEGLPGPAQDVVVGLGGIAAAAGPVLMVGGTLARSWKDIAATFPKVKGAMGSAASFMTGPWGVATAGVVAGLAIWADHAEEVRQSTENLRRALGDATDDIAKQTDAWIINEMQSRDVLHFLDQFGLGFDDVRTAIQGTDGEFRNLLQEIQGGPSLREFAGTVLPGLRSHSRDLSETIIELRGAYENYNVQQAAANDLAGQAGLTLEELDPAAAAAAGAIAGLGEDTDNTASQVERLTASLDAQRDMLRAMSDPVFAITDAKKELAEADAAVAKALKEHGRGSDEYKQALQEQAQAGIGLRADLLGFASALATQKDGIGDLGRELDQLVRADYIDRAAADLTLQLLGDIADTAQQLDGSDPTVRVYTDMEEALRQLRAAADLTARLGATINLEGTVNFGGGLQARADGGPVTAGMPYLVGEQGMEMFVPNTSGTVLSADETVALLRQIRDGLSRREPHSGRSEALNVNVTLDGARVNPYALG